MNKPRRLARKSWVLVLCLTLVLNIFSAVYDSSTNEVHAAFANGDGTEGHPYLIETAVQLNDVRDGLDKHYKLNADIDLDVAPYNEVEGWLPIGDSSNAFSGSFDGAGFTISGLMIRRSTEDNIGLFGAVNNAQITNVILTDVSVEGNARVGGLVGYESNSKGTIIGSSVSGIVLGKNTIGGMVGRTNGEIRSSSSTVEAIGEQYVGGLVGNSGVAITDSFATGDISADAEIVGGLIGFADGTAIINSSATGIITSAGDFAGGLVGIAAGSEITNSYAAGDVRGKNYVGGLVGRIAAVLSKSATITSSYAVGDVSGESQVGGLAGLANATIGESFATGTVSGTEVEIGGLVGLVDGSAQLLNAYASGAVSGASGVGALVGRLNQSTFIINNYAVGKVTSAGNPKGGLVGILVPGGTVTDSFYDTATTTQGDNSGKGIPKSTAEMKSEGTFTNWDYNQVWFIEEGSSYPKLQQFVTGLHYDKTDYVLKVGGTEQVGLEIVYVDNSRTAVTSPVQFVMNPAHIAAVSLTGELTGVAVGSTNLTATLGNISEVVDVIVSARGIIYVKEDGDDNEAGTSWATAFASLEKALDESAEGDRIWIAKGTYYPTKRIVQNDPRTAAFQMKNGVEIRGGFAGNEPVEYNLARRDFVVNKTILSGNIGDPVLHADNAYHVFYHPAGLNLDHTALLEGVTITGGNDNTSNDGGGGMHNNASSPTLTNVIISGNAARFGGGLYNGNSSSPTLNGVEISENAAGFGAGVYNDNSEPKFTNVVIKNNIAAQVGGGMANFDSRPILLNVMLTGNTAIESGGGMFVFESDPILDGVTISGNIADDGGGVYIHQLSNPQLTNVTISTNTATNVGGGIYIAASSNPTINNSIIWGNSSSIEKGIGSQPTYSHSLIEGSGGSDDWNPIYGIDDGGNLDVDPTFMAPEAFANTPSDGGNYRLKAGSPAIDAGSNSLVTAGVTTDLDENPRIRYGTVDMGAYEYYVAPPIVSPPIVVPGNGNDGGNGGDGGDGAETIPTTPTTPEESTAPTPPLVEFTDIVGHWAEEVIKKSVQDGIVNGYPDHSFRPDNSITRAEFTTMLANVLGLTGGGAELTFTDHKQIGTWALQAVAQAYEAGLSKGYDDGTFRPNNNITRAEMAMMIARALDLAQDAAATDFADDADVPAWAKGAVEAVRLSGIIQGRGGNRFVPQDNATRAEALTMLVRMAEAK